MESKCFSAELMGERVLKEECLEETGCEEETNPPKAEYERNTIDQM